MKKYSPNYRVVDMHTAGEPVRIVVDGYPELFGRTLLQKRKEARELHDHIRRRLILEPRGHSEMYGVVPVEPSNSDAVLGLLFMHNSGYSTMCGHATIAVGRWIIDSEIVTPRRPTTSFSVECPCGIVDLIATETPDGHSISFLSVEAFSYALDLHARIREFGSVILDISYGGAFYAILPASRLGLDLRKSRHAELVSAASIVTEHIRQNAPILHPSEPELAFLYGTILTDDVPASAADPTYNLCVFGDGQVDRSPTGSGVTARMILDYTKGHISLNSRREFRGPSAESFFGTVRMAFANGSARIEVEGCAYYTGKSEFIFEANDLLADGFIIRASASSFRDK